MFTTLAPKSFGVPICMTKVVFVDTVGFIKNIPYEIIEAFNAVLEEISDSDIVMLVLDSSEDISRILDKAFSSLDVLRKIGVVGKPMIVVMNKIDLVRSEELEEKMDAVKTAILPEYGGVVDIVPVSALRGYGVEEVKKAVCRAVESLQKSLGITSLSYVSATGQRVIKGLRPT